MIQGELGLKIIKIEITRFDKNDNDCELHLYDINGGVLHIVGSNNLPKLLKEALDDIVDYNYPQTI